MLQIWFYCLQEKNVYSVPLLHFKNILFFWLVMDFTERDDISKG